MNSISSRLKAIAITAAFFAASAFTLLGVIWTLSALPSPWQGRLDAYSATETIVALSDLRQVVALSAAFLVANALVVLLGSDYLDKMIAIFADVLLMLVAAVGGFMFGYWVMLRLAGSGITIGWPFIQTALISPVIVFAVSLISPRWARSALALRGLVIIASLAGAAIMLISLP